MESIRIVKLDALTGRTGAAGAPGEAVAPPGGLASDLMRAGLEYRAQAPLVDRMLREAGLGPLDDPATARPDDADG